MDAAVSTGARAGRAGRAAGTVAAVLAMVCAGGAVAGPSAAVVRTDPMTIDGGSWRRPAPSADLAADFPTVRRGHARGTMLAV